MPSAVELAGELPDAPAAPVGAAPASAGVGRRRACGAMSRSVAGGIGEGQRLLARAAGHAQRQFAALGHGEDACVRLRLAVGGQEHRRLAGIGGRRHPGVDARRHGFERRPCAWKPSATLPPSGPKEKAKAVDQQQRRRGAQRPRDRARERGCAAGRRRRRRGCAAMRRWCSRHSASAKALSLAARPVGLHQHRRMQRARWRARCGGRSRRPSAGGRSAADRARRAPRRPSAAITREPRHVGHDAEDAEPGQAEEQADDDQERKDERPAAFDDHRRADRQARPRKPCRQSSSSVVCRMAFPSSALPGAAREIARLSGLEE